MSGNDPWGPGAPDDGSGGPDQPSSANPWSGQSGAGGSGGPEGPDDPGTPEPDLGSSSRRRGGVSRVTYGVGEVLLTLGAVLLLFVTYTLWWTGVETGSAQDDLKSQLESQWATGSPQPGQSVGLPTPGATEEEPQEMARPELGDAVAILRIPRFGRGYAWAVVEGVDIANLARGPGHYPSTALPGEVGNFAVAGHRATHGEPFAQFEALRSGDQVVIETATQWFTYTIYKIDYPVPVTSGWAIDPNPDSPGQQPTKAIMTLTTCHPRWASTYRFLVFSELTETTPKYDAEGEEQLPPALAGFETED